MSLDTVLQIGKILREGSKDKMKHFRYVDSPIDKDGNYPLCLTISIKEDLSFDFSNIKMISQLEKEKLYYLRYKTSNSDSSAAKYIFGDIFYKINRSFDNKGEIKEAKESGNYIIQKSNAFTNADKAREKILKSLIDRKKDNVIFKGKNKITAKEVERFIYGENVLEPEKIKDFVFTNKLLLFWKIFKENQDKIEQILAYAPIFESNASFDDIEDRYIQYIFDTKYDKIKKTIQNKKTIEELDENERGKLLKYADHSVSIHFDFINQQWYEIPDIFNIVIESLNQELTSKQNDSLLVPTSFIYRTLCSGNNKNDIQFPLFTFENSHKSFAFNSAEQFNDFLFADAIMNKSKMWIKGTNINIFVFPFSFSNQQITAEDYESFFFDGAAENTLFSFGFLDEEDNEKFTRFDFVFSDSGGNITRDLIELSGIGRSQLLDVRNRISQKESDISKEKETDLGWTNVRMKLENSFTNLLGKGCIENNEVCFRNYTVSNGKKKPYVNYQAHMIKVLPLIYTSNYYSDAGLLHDLLEKVEFTIRNDNEDGNLYGNYALLKYDLKLILSIQNNKNDKYMEITDSKSYQLGVKMGKISKPLKKEINSFEKTYVGLLTRRVATKDDCIKFFNDICEKLIMHKKTWEGAMCAEVCNDLSQLTTAEFDKDKIAFGFLEGYFKYEPTDKKKDFQTRLEKILSDYTGNEDFKYEVEKLSELLNEFNNK